MLDDETIRTWKANYKLDTMTPEGAMTWWYANNNGMAPAAAIAALGLALKEIERLKREVVSIFEDLQDAEDELYGLDD